MSEDHPSNEVINTATGKLITEILGIVLVAFAVLFIAFVTTQAKKLYQFRHEHEHERNERIFRELYDPKRAPQVQPV